MKVGMMKRAVAVLLIIIIAVLLQQGLAVGISDSAGITGSGVSLFSPGSDSRKMQERLSEAIAGLSSKKRGGADEGSETLAADSASNVSASANGSFNNSGLQNDLLNNTISDQINPSSPDVTGRQNVGSSSQGSFKGFYGMTASRHEIGKSGIDSSMFLSGTFEMDKSVKFQDQGF
jgi:hypothetical protein